MAELSAAAPTQARPTKQSRPKGAGVDPWFKICCAASATLILSALTGVMITLAVAGWPAFSTFKLAFFTSTEWNPVTDVYGGAGPIVGTILTAAAALVFALPLSFATAVFLTEFCPRPLRRPIGVAVELLAGIPSIVYGIWGLFVFAPLFAKWVEIPLMSWAPPGSIWETLFSGIPNGSGLLTASIIVAMMILPYISATLRELLLSVPVRVRESAYGVGCTPLEVVWSVTLPYVRRGAIGAVMLGLGRALGETMAVTFVIGNSHDFPHGLFDGGSTIASTIANEFAEATSDMHVAALAALGLVLFLMTFIILTVARLLLGAQKNA